MMSSVFIPTVEGDFILAGQHPFRLACGQSLQPLILRYAMYGRLNPERDNAILVCHALSGSARVADWWPQFVGAGKLFDTRRYCVIGVNVLGSCYVSTGPAALNPQRPGETYGSDFPLITIGDITRAQARLMDHLGIERLRAVV